jgi:hypothetical protein
MEKVWILVRLHELTKEYEEKFTMWNDIPVEYIRKAIENKLQENELEPEYEDIILTELENLDTINPEGFKNSYNFDDLY